MRGAYVGLLIVALTSCQSTMSHQSAVDHILLGAPNLDAGMAAFEKATGVKPARGGTHPGRGTRNALVSLGNGTYLEIIAPQEQPDATTDMVKQLQALSSPKLIAWAERVDAASARDALAREGFTLTESQPGSRVTPSGARLDWTTFDIVTPHISAAPFFIEWGKTTTHPSITSPSGCTMAAFEVTDPNADALNRMLKATGMSMRVQSADRSRLRLALQCGSRSTEFTSD
jgi:hypothetical protein